MHNGRSAPKRGGGLQQALDKIPLPVEGRGPCKNSKRCGAIDSRTILGNGLCVDCWDRGLNDGYKRAVNRKKRTIKKGKK